MKKNTVCISLDEYNQLLTRLNDVSVIAVNRLEQLARINEICMDELEHRGSYNADYTSVYVKDILTAMNKNYKKIVQTLIEKEVEERAAAEKEEEDLEF